MASTFPIGSFVRVPFGGAGVSQIAHVEGFARDGRLKIRAWNATQGYWMPGHRLVEERYLTPAGDVRGLPAVPAVGAKTKGAAR